MRNNKPALLIGFLLVRLFCAGQDNHAIVYPETRKMDQVDDYFGTKVADPYRWLENDTSDETREWVKKENEITRSYFDKIPYRHAIGERVQELYNYPKYSAPFRNGDYFYFYKNDGLQNQAVLYRQKGLNGQPVLVMDPNKLSADGTTRLMSFTLSKNGHYAAYSLSKGGSDWQIFYVRDMNTGADLPDTLKWVKFSGAAWLGDGFYYSRFPQPQPGMELYSKNEHEQVFFHKVGTPQDEDKLVYEDKTNPKTLFGVSTTEDEHYAFLFVEDPEKGVDGNSLAWIDTKSGEKDFHPIIDSIGKYKYFPVDNDGNKFLVQTNDGAPNSKIVLIDPAHPDKAHWKLIVPEKKEPIDQAGTAAERLYIAYLRDVTSKVDEYTYDGKFLKEIPLPGLGNASGFNGLHDDKYIFYEFTSLTFPTTIYRYEIATGKSSIFQQPKLLFNPGDYETKQVFYPSKDGTKIPMFVVYRKGLKLDGNNPTELYAYGGFDISSLPYFSPSLIPWLEMGGVFAMANLRGGGEYGEAWHEAGMRFRKQNVFDDFIAAAEYLIKEKYTSPQRLMVRGGSNGGLLIGAVVNQRPDLFRVAIPQFGVMDMLRFQKFTIGAAWISEYGSSDNAADFKNLYAYSPLHNIRSGVSYPAILVTTADHDDRVVPAHSFKYTATLQEKYKGDNPILIRIDTNSGHGASNTTKNIETISDIYAFGLYNMGITPVLGAGKNAQEKKAF